MYFIHRTVPPAISKDLFTLPWQIIYTSLGCRYPSLPQKALKWREELLEAETGTVMT